MAKFSTTENNFAGFLIRTNSQLLTIWLFRITRLHTRKGEEGGV